MTRTKLDTPAFADQSVDTRNIADGTVQAQDMAPGTVSADKLSDTLDLSSKTVTLANTSVANTKLANSSFTINGSSLALGASTSIITFLDWQAVVVADGSTTLNAVAGRGYFLDTNTGVIEVFLPSSPSRGDTFAFVDYSGTFSTNKLIINTGGVSIDSSITDGSSAGNEYQVITNNAIVELVYVDAAKGYQVMLNRAAGTTPDSALTGFSSSYNTIEPTFVAATGGTVLTSGDFKTHIFVGDGNFVVSSVGNASAQPAGGPSVVDYLVVAGGGGGGSNNYGGGSIPRGSGGGGAGGFRMFSTATGSNSPLNNSGASPNTEITVTAGPTTYPITVGAGGAGAPSGSPDAGSDGNNSVFSTVTSALGGNGGGHDNSTAGAGGSGGGGRNAVSGGAGNTPPVSPPQGNPGGDGAPSSGTFNGSGGGGAGAAGSDGNPAGVGGIGSYVADSFFGPTAPSYGDAGPVSSTRYFSGGGAGSPGPGGAVDGGDGGGGPKGTAGTANTGGGGGANSPGAGGAGGKGIVAIRYKFQ